MKLTAAICSVALASCASTACPDRPAIHSWTLSENKQITREHNALPYNSILRPVLDEWESLRKQLKN